jgi:hypothetical protein
MNKNKFHQRYGLSDSYKNITLNPSSIKIIIIEILEDQGQNLKKIIIKKIKV